MGAVPQETADSTKLVDTAILSVTPINELHPRSSQKSFVIGHVLMQDQGTGSDFERSSQHSIVVRAPSVKSFEDDHVGPIVHKFSAESPLHEFEEYNDSDSQ